MSQGSVSIVLDRRAFEPGETLRGSYRLVMAEPSRLQEVEVTVGWHTEGEGRAARAVEHREIHRAGEDSRAGSGPGKFSAVLPASPLSYDGVLIKVRWAVRVRASFSGPGHLNSEEVFQLGHVRSVVTEKTSPAERPKVMSAAGDSPKEAGESPWGKIMVQLVGGAAVIGLMGWWNRKALVQLFRYLFGR